MKRYLLSAGIVCFVGWGLIGLYRWPVFINSFLENPRMVIDEYSAEQFKKLNRNYMFWHTLFPGNSDKYVCRPPRIVPGLTIQGRPAYKMYGMVTDWSPEDRLLELSTYTGKRMRVRFDPTKDQCMAHRMVLIP